jgi:HK97 family phage portal protein
MTGIVPPHSAGTMSAAGVSVNERNITTAGPVNRAISLITSQFLTLGFPQPWTLAYGEDSMPYHQPVKPVPQLLLNTWGPNRTQSDGYEELIYSLALFGEAYGLVLERDDMGDATALDLLPTMMVEHKRLKGVDLYDLIVGSQRQPLPAGDVVHIRMRARPGRLRGASALDENRLWFGLYMAAIQYASNFFSQGVSSSYVLTTKEKIGQDVQDRIMAKLQIEHSGLANSHIPQMFDSGIAPAKIGILPAEAMNLETLEAGTNAVAAYFGLPASWLNGTNAPNSLGKTLQEENTFFVASTLNLYVYPVQESLSGLLPRAQQCSFNTRRLQRGDSGNLAKELTAIRGGTIMTPDEIRREFYDLGPLPDGQGADANAPLASNLSPTTGGIMGEDSLGAGAGSGGRN